MRASWFLIIFYSVFSFAGDQDPSQIDSVFYDAKEHFFVVQGHFHEGINGDSGLPDSYNLYSISNSGKETAHLLIDIEDILPQKINLPAAGNYLSGSQAYSEMVKVVKNGKQKPFASVFKSFIDNLKKEKGLEPLMAHIVQEPGSNDLIALQTEGLFSNPDQYLPHAGDEGEGQWYRSKTDSILFIDFECHSVEGEGYCSHLFSYFPEGYVRARKKNNEGLIFYRNKNYTKAIELFEESARLDPQYVLAHTNLASVYSIKGDQSSAISSLKKALALDPQLTVKKMSADSDFSHLRANPEFQKLLRNAK